MSKNETILVTGGAGFIGSHQCEYLLEQGYKVRVLDDLSTGFREFLPSGVDFVEGTILDKELCSKVAKGVSGIIHLAAMSRMGPSMDVPELCVNANVNGTLNMLLAAREHKVPAFLYAGSSTYYGLQPAPHHLGLKEDCLNPYAASKYMGEILAQNFFKSYEVPVLCVRYFNVYGKRQPATGPYALVMGIFLDRIANNQSLIVHGDGSQRRDFIHVRDVVEANLKCILKMQSGIQKTETLNIGSGTNISIIELAQILSDRIEFGDRRKGDAMETLADISRTIELIGWRPRVKFEDGLLELKEERLRRAV